MEDNSYKKDIKVIKTKKPDKTTKGLIAIGIFFFLIFISLKRTLLTLVMR